MKTLKFAGLVAAIVLGTVPAAQAKEIGRGWYVSADVSGTGVAMLPDDTSDASRTFVAVGVGSRVSLCSNGLGNSDWIDFCLGTTGFWGGVNNLHTTSGMADVVYSTDIQSLGFFGQAKVMMGPMTFSPLIGVSQVWAQTDYTATVGSYSEDGTINSEHTVVFGGTELAANLFDGRGELGARAQVGRGINLSADDEFTFLSGTVFARVSF